MSAEPLTMEQSVQRLLQQKQLVIRDFYEHFLRDVPQARPFFDGVDLDRQSSMLTMALMVVETHGRASFPAVEHYLRVLGDRHAHIGVPPELYPAFAECLVQSIRNFHSDDWNEQLENQWKRALHRTIETMLKGYARPYIF